MNLVRTFFPKIRAFFFKFWKRAGETSPHSSPLVTRLGKVHCTNIKNNFYLIDCLIFIMFKSNTVKILKFIDKLFSYMSLVCYALAATVGDSSTTLFVDKINFLKYLNLVLHNKKNLFLHTHLIYWKLYFCFH